MSDLLYFIFLRLARGVNYGVSKQLLPMANQPKSRFALEVPGIRALCFFRFQFTSLKPLKSRRRRVWGVIGLQVTWEFTAFIPRNHSLYNRSCADTIGTNWLRPLAFSNENLASPYQCPMSELLESSFWCLMVVVLRSTRGCRCSVRG